MYILSVIRKLCIIVNEPQLLLLSVPSVLYRLNFCVAPLWWVHKGSMFRTYGFQIMFSMFNVEV